MTTIMLTTPEEPRLKEEARAPWCHLEAHSVSPDDLEASARVLAAVGALLLEGGSGRGGRQDGDGDGEAEGAAAPPPTKGVTLPKVRRCYYCRVRFRDVHHFYGGKLCPPCAGVSG
jgi:hypothetical protein